MIRLINEFLLYHIITFKMKIVYHLCRLGFINKETAFKNLDILEERFNILTGKK